MHIPELRFLVKKRPYAIHMAALIIQVVKDVCKEVHHSLTTSSVRK